MPQLTVGEAARQARYRELAGSGVASSLVMDCEDLFADPLHWLNDTTLNGKQVTQAEINEYFEKERPAASALTAPHQTAAENRTTTVRGRGRGQPLLKSVVVTAASKAALHRHRLKLSLLGELRDASSVSVSPARGAKQRVARPTPDAPAKMAVTVDNSDADTSLAAPAPSKPWKMRGNRPAFSGEGIPYSIAYLEPREGDGEMEGLASTPMASATTGAQQRTTTPLSVRRRRSPPPVNARPSEPFHVDVVSERWSDISAVALGGHPDQAVSQRRPLSSAAHAEAMKALFPLQQMDAPSAGHSAFGWQPPQPYSAAAYDAAADGFGEQRSFAHDSVSSGGNSSIGFASEASARSMYAVDLEEEGNASNIANAGDGFLSPSVSRGLNTSARSSDAGLVRGFSTLAMSVISSSSERKGEFDKGASSSRNAAVVIGDGDGIHAPGAAADGHASALEAPSAGSSTNVNDGGSLLRSRAAHDGDRPLSVTRRKARFADDAPDTHSADDEQVDVSCADDEDADADSFVDRRPARRDVRKGRAHPPDKNATARMVDSRKGKRLQSGAKRASGRGRATEFSEQRSRTPKLLRSDNHKRSMQRQQSSDSDTERDGSGSEHSESSGGEGNDDRLSGSSGHSSASASVILRSRGIGFSGRDQRSDEVDNSDGDSSADSSEGSDRRASSRSRAERSRDSSASTSNGSSLNRSKPSDRKGKPSRRAGSGRPPDAASGSLRGSGDMNNEDGYRSLVYGAMIATREEQLRRMFSSADEQLLKLAKLARPPQNDNNSSKGMKKKKDDDKHNRRSPSRSSSSHRDSDDGSYSSSGSYGSGRSGYDSYGGEGSSGGSYGSGGGSYSYDDDRGASSYYSGSRSGSYDSVSGSRSASGSEYGVDDYSDGYSSGRR